MHPHTFTLYRLDPPSADGERPRRESPSGFFSTMADARREARHLNRRARERNSPWRWRCRPARPGEGEGMGGF
ncbi:MAG: hypothetical protein IT452_07045 [Planctomycetia bacterium]|nr:hypothetical protein [Planctomycetia bacterium]